MVQLSDPFDFVGKDLLVVMTHDAFFRTFTFGDEVPGTEGAWLLGGRAVAEVPGIGFWFVVRTITSPRGKTAAAAESARRIPPISSGGLMSSPRESRR